MPPENLLVRPEVRGLLEPEWPQITNVGEFKQLGGGGFFGGIKIQVARCKFTNWPYNWWLQRHTQATFFEAHCKSLSSGQLGQLRMPGKQHGLPHNLMPRATRFRTLKVFSPGDALVHQEVRLPILRCSAAMSKSNKKILGFLKWRYPKMEFAECKKAVEMDDLGDIWGIPILGNLGARPPSIQCSPNHTLVW